MANVFLIYDSNGNIQQVTTSYPNVTPPSQLLVLNDTDTNAQNALAQPSNYMVQNGKVIPAVTIHVDRTHAVSGAWDTYTLTITTSDNAAHTVNVSFLGYTTTVTTALPTGQSTGTYSAQLQIALHVSLSNTQIDVNTSGTGLITLDTFIGGNTSASGIQVFKDTNGLLHIAPTSKSFLSNYWTSQAVNTAYSAADIGTWLSMLLQTVYGVILPKLTAGTTPLVTLDANQTNGVNDITTSLLPNLLTTLENAAPVPSPTPTTWAASTAYVANANVYPTTSNGFYYACTTAGNSGATQPTWPTTAGATVTDGTAVWTCHALPAKDLHYSHAVQTFVSTKAAMDNYVADLSAIPNLV